MRVTRLNTAILGIGVLVLVGIVVMSYREWKLHQAARADALRISVILGSVNNLIIGMLDADTGQRGFALTGEEQYLEPYNRGIQTVPAELANLNRLLAERPSMFWSTPLTCGPITIGRKCCPNIAA